MHSLEILMLGPLKVSLKAEPLQVDTRKALGLLAYLALTGERHNREALVTLFWPESDPDRGRSVLRRTLSTLNKALGERWLDADRESVALAADDDLWVDALEFERLITKTETHEHIHDTPCRACLEALEKAVGLHRGEFLEGFSLRGSTAFDDWQIYESERLRRRMAGALERLVDEHTALQQFARAIEFGQRWLALDPLHEPAHRQLMRLHTWAGNRAAALKQYEACEKVLEAELGVPPMEETTTLFEEIKAGQLGPLETLATRPIAPAEPEVLPSPYRGLYAFREEDAPFFFGREVFTDKLVEAVQRHPLVCVMGPSGSGKSSVVAAGLVARLRRQGDWQIASLRPGSEPLQALAAALIPFLEPELRPAEQLDEARQLAAALTSYEARLVDLADQIMNQDPAAPRLLLVIDQFEELYTLPPEDDQRRQFLDQLLETARVLQTEARYSCVFTLRTDFLGQALAYRPFADALQDADVKLGPMNRDELDRAIGMPARRMGVAFEPGLVSRILDDVADEPGQLPLLEFALSALWVSLEDGQITHEAYDRIGRVSGALARYADDVFDNLPPAEQEAARRVFVQLVRPGEGTEDTRRLTNRAELGSQEWTLVSRLADARLVVAGRSASGEDTAEVVHEALIQGWGRLREWMAEDRAFRVWQERLRAAIRQWEASERDAGALLRGVALAEAENWLETKANDLSQVEASYIQASIENRDARQAERERTRLERESLRRRLTWGLGIGLIIAVALSAVAFILWQGASRDRDRAQAAEQIAIERLSVQLAAQALSQPAAQADLALLLAVEAVNIADTPESQEALSEVVNNNWHVQSMYHLPLSDSPNSRGGLSQDARTFAFSRNLILHMLDLTTGELRTSDDFILDEPLYPSSIAFSPDGDRLAAIGANGISVHDSQTGARIGDRLPDTTGAINLLFSPDGKTLASYGEGPVVLWDLGSSQEIARIEPGNNVPDGVAFSPDGRFLAVGGLEDESGTAWGLYDTTTGAQTALLSAGDDPSEGPSFFVSFDPSGRVLAAGAPGLIRFWDVETGEQIAPPVNIEGLFALEFSPDGQLMAAGTESGEILIWNISEQSPHLPPLEHAGLVFELAFQPDSQTLVSMHSTPALEGATAVVWDLAGGDPSGLSLEGHIEEVISLQFDQEGTNLVSIDRERQIRRWEIATGLLIGEPAQAPDGEAYPGGWEIAADGQLGYLNTFEGPVEIWNTADGKPTDRRLEGPTLPIADMAATADGRLAIGSGCLEGTLEGLSCDAGGFWVWDMETTQIVAGPHRTSAPVINVALSEDGRWALTNSLGDVQLWDLKSGEAVQAHDVSLTQANRESGAPLEMAFSPNNQTFVIGGLTGIELWEFSEDGVTQRSTDAQVSNIMRLAFSPDGSLIAAGTESGLIALWDIKTLELLARPAPIHREPVVALAFSPNSSLLASGSLFDRVFLLKIDEHIGQGSSQSLIDRACTIANRNLTETEWSRYFGEEPYRETCPDVLVLPQQ